MDAEAVREAAADLPAEPGTYQFRADGRTLYVGKAVDLRSRVRSYARPRSERIARMVAAAETVDVAVTDTETQALLLEANLIKRHSPRYNVRLTDDKSYPMVQLTDHPVPRIEMTRDPDPGATAYGPFTSVSRVETVLKALRETYGLRGCSEHKYSGRDRPCLDYEMGLCSAPCTGEISEADYAEDVAAVRRFLDGETAVLADPLRREMERAAADRAFERAANLRDRLAVVESFHDGGREVVAGEDGDGRRTDVLGVAVAGREATVARLHAEDRKLVDRERHTVAAPRDRPTCPDPEAGTGSGTETGAGSGTETGTRTGAGADDGSEAGGAAADGGVDAEARAGDGSPPVGPRSDRTEDGDGVDVDGDGVDPPAAPERPADDRAAVLSAFVPQFYAERRLPDRLLVPVEPGESVRSWLDREGVEVSVPGAGRDGRLVDLALKNARRGPDRPDGVGALAARLDGPADRIEGFDVSHTGGDDVVGSNVCFVDGDPRKADYRRTRLPEGNDDPARMAALVEWRARRAVEGRDDRPDPDLLLVDGGHEQLRAARAALDAVGWSVPVLAMAKGPDRDADRVVAPDGRADWDPEGAAVGLLRRVRDEAHRFAVDYHRTLRDDASTALDDVPGVGPETRKRLLRRFGSVAAVREASREELQSVEGVGEKTAAAVERHL